MNIKKIIVGADLSEPSVVALEHAKEIARRSGAEIVLVHAGEVHDMATDDAWPSKATIEYYRLILADRQAHTRRRLSTLVERHSGQGVSISTTLIDGFPDTGLCQAAAELNADLLVVGTHGRTGAGRFLLGSVAERVVRLAETNVLVAREGRARGGYQRILVPTDFSAIAEKALDLAVTVAAEGAHIDLLHCYERPSPIGGMPPLSGQLQDYQSICESLESDAIARMKQLASNYRDSGIHFEVEITGGPPARRIRGRCGGYDLIAMGSHGRRGFRRFMLGSVAEATVRHAPCSVMVAHGGDRRE